MITQHWTQTSSGRPAGASAKNGAPVEPRTFPIVVAVAMISCFFVPATTAKEIVGVWQTKAKDNEGRHDEYRSLYKAITKLIQAGAKISVRRAVIEDNELGVAGAAKRVGLYSGKYPGELTQLYCLLNVGNNRCVEPLEKLCEGIFIPTPKELHPGDEIFLPLVDVKTRSIYREFDKDSAQRLEQFVVKHSTCDEFDGRCQKGVYSLNKFNYDFVDPDSRSLKPRYVGKVVLPTVSYTSTLSMRLPENDLTLKRFMEDVYSGETAFDEELLPSKLADDINYRGVDCRATMKLDSPESEERYDSKRAGLAREALRIMSPNLLPRPKEEYAPASFEGDVSADYRGDPIDMAVIADPDMVESHLEAPASWEEFRTSRRRLFELIRHPIAEGKPITNRKMIAIMDGWFDDDHCVIDWTRVKHIGNTDAGTDTPAGGDLACVGKSVGFEEWTDHGVHVLSILASEDSSPLGRGAAHDAFFTVDQVVSDRNIFLERATTAYEYLTIGDHDEYLDPEVINISVTYDASDIMYTETTSNRIDNFFDTLAQPNAPLLVAAAGKEGLNLGGTTCTLIPPCYGKHLANILTVTAITNHKTAPELYSYEDPFAGVRKSNFGPMVHLAAPAEKVIGAVNNNRVAPLSGSSQAAPLVAAAASLLFAQVNTNPERVRDRLIVSSDLFETLLSSQIVGGRLNIKNALNFDVDLITYAKEDEPGEFSFKGKYFKFRVKRGDKNWVPCYTSHWEDVLRLWRHPGQEGTTNIVYEIMMKDSTLWVDELNKDYKQECVEEFPAGKLVRRTVKVPDLKKFDFEWADLEGNEIPVSTSDLRNYIAKSKM